MEQRNCSQCGAPLDPKAQTCRYCGEAIPAVTPNAVAPIPQQSAPIAQQPYPQPYQAAPPAYPQPYQAALPTYPQQPYAQPPAYAQPQYVQPQYAQPVSNKSKTTAGLLAIFLGGLGVHKFYLRRPGLGILYLLFCWTYIPAIIGLIEGIIYLSASDQKFYEKYVRK